jgi:hypothetical protein
VGHPATPLLGFAYPGILPRHRDVLVVAAKAGVGTIVVADFYRLVLAHRERGRHSDTRARLPGGDVLYAAQTRNTAEPEVTIERKPKPWLHVVAQVAFEGADRLYRLGLRSGD